MRRFLGLFAISILIACGCRAAEVTCREDRGGFILSNGHLEVWIDGGGGNVGSVKLGGKELLCNGTGYWSMAANSMRSRVAGFGRAASRKMTIDPAMNVGVRAEVAVLFDGTGRDGSYPGKAEVRYSLGHDADVLHMSAILRHGKGDAAFRIGEGRFVLKLDPKTFNRLTVDGQRDRVMPTGEDWEQGETLNMKEVRRMKTGLHVGEVEHKYSYSALLGETPAYGWSGGGFGVWMINPSMEYIAGGPTKMELTGHLDVGGKAEPTLLNMWHGSHYGGTVLSLDADEVWSRVIGPFAIYFNQGEDVTALHADAVRQALAEQKAWPYAWVKDEAYPSPSERGGVTGKIDLIDDEKPGGRFWVGLTSPPYLAGGTRRAKEGIDWQRDGKFYQYWTKADADGGFHVTGVRPGVYELHAFVDGILGELIRPGVVVVAGEDFRMDVVSWKPGRAGPTLWQIGIADRSAAEFKNGDQYWKWGNYYQFKKDFPGGVNYQVGVSDWKKDWHLCQPLSLADNGTVLGSSTWNVRFPMDAIPAGGARLRISICGSREGSQLGLILNGKALGKAMDLPEDGVMHRDSHRGRWYEQVVDVPALMLQTGENLLQFRLSGKVWHQGILYDCIRLEAVSAAGEVQMKGD